MRARPARPISARGRRWVGLGRNRPAVFPMNPPAPPRPAPCQHPPRPPPCLRQAAPENPCALWRGPRFLAERVTLGPLQGHGPARSRARRCTRGKAPEPRPAIDFDGTWNQSTSRPAGVLPASVRRISVLPQPKLRWWPAVQREGVGGGRRVEGGRGKERKREGGREGGKERERAAATG